MNSYTISPPLARPHKYLNLSTTCIVPLVAPTTQHMLKIILVSSTNHLMPQPVTEGENGKGNGAISL